MCEEKRVRGRLTEGWDKSVSEQLENTDRESGGGEELPGERLENRPQAEGPLGVRGALRDSLVSNQILLVGSKAHGGENVI